jgi:cytochrome c oxidase subunit 3
MKSYMLMPSETGERQYAIHPSSVMMVLILSGITTLFGALVIAYVYSRAGLGMHGISIPLLFFINTIVLIGAGYCIEQCRRYFRNRIERKTIRWGYATILLTLLFLCMQGFAWYSLLTNQIKPGSSGGHGYLYAISILHFLHVGAGIPFLLRLLIPMHLAYLQGNASLLFIDDHIKRKLRHTVWYWHFIDAVWISLMIVFLAGTFW